MKSKPPFTPSEGSDFANKSKDGFFLGSEAGRHFGFKLQSRPVEVFPEILSDNPTYLAFLSKLSKRLYEELPKKKVLENGFFDENAITTNFQELNTVAGYNMSPATYAVIDNTMLRQEIFLNSDFESERDLAIFKELMNVRYSTHDGSRGKISRISSSTFPFFSKSVELKANHLSLLLKKGKNVESYIMNGDLRGLYKEVKLLFGMVDVYRSQADVFVEEGSTFVPKKRKVNDIEYSISGGKLGKRFDANKDVVVGGRKLPNKAACRARTAYGFSNAPNLMMTAAFEGFRHYADSTFNLTYKHTTREAILAKIKKFSNAIAVDVTQYDQTIPYFLMEKWIEFSPFNEFGKKMLELMVNAPMFYRGVSTEAKAYWSGDPTDVAYFNQYKGLISGLFSTSAMGKDFFTFCILTILDKVYGDVLGNVEKILRWEHPVYAITNMGDDSNIHFNDAKFGEFVKTQLATTQYGMSPYFKVDIEDGFKFVGNIGYIDAHGEKQMCGDIGTYFKNMLVPERSINGSHRQYGVYGLLERRGVYSSHPLFTQADSIFQEEFRLAFNVNWLDYMEKHLVMPKNEKATVMSQAELEVVLDPSKLHYKYNEDEIRQDILDIIEERISDDNTVAAVNLLIDKDKVKFKYKNIIE